jgi:hypothetical protein
MLPEKALWTDTTPYSSEIAKRFGDFSINVDDSNNTCLDD